MAFIISKKIYSHFMTEAINTMALLKLIYSFIHTKYIKRNWPTLIILSFKKDI